MSRANMGAVVYIVPNTSRKINAVCIKGGCSQIGFAVAVSVLLAEAAGRAQCSRVAVAVSSTFRVLSTAARLRCSRPAH